MLPVAEAGSFRKAANGMRLGQSAVSRRVQRLEDVLGVSMFERRSHGARLTAAEASFASQMRSILHDLDCAIDAAHSHGGATTGQLRIGIIASLSHGSLRNVVKAFLDSHGQVDLRIDEADRSKLMTSLSHRQLDAVVAAGEPQPENGDGLVLARETIFLAVATDHEWAKRGRLSWNDVQSTVFVLSAIEPGPEIHDYAVRRISDLGRTVDVRRHRLGREGIMNLVGLGLGVSLVADHWRGVNYPNVTFVPIGDEEERVPFSLTWRPENDNPALRRFVSLARVHARNAAAGDPASQRPDPSP